MKSSMTSSKLDIMPDNSSKGFQDLLPSWLYKDVVCLARGGEFKKKLAPATSQHKIRISFIIIFVLLMSLILGCNTVVLRCESVWTWYSCLEGVNSKEATTSGRVVFFSLLCCRSKQEILFNESAGIACTHTTRRRRK